MQCRRARIPVVAPVSDLSDLAGRPGIVVAARDGGPAAEIPAPTPRDLDGGGRTGGWIRARGGRGAGADRSSRACRRYVLRAQTAPRRRGRDCSSREGLGGPDVACDAAITVCESPREA